MSEIVPEEERDGTFARLFLQPENKVCFDCNAANPKWASVNNAVFICFQCAGKHRTFGVQTSFVRSCGLDKWNRKQLKQMELGGNKAAKAYFEKHDLIQAGQHNYTLPLVVKYRVELAKRAESAIAQSIPEVTAAEPVPGPAPAKEETKTDDFFAAPAAPAKLQPMTLGKKKEIAPPAPLTLPSSTKFEFCDAVFGSRVKKKNNTRNRKEARQQPVVKAKKLDIDFDNLGTSADEAVTEEKVAPVQKMAPVVAPSLPKPKSEPVVGDTAKFKKMKAISSTDDMYRFCGLQ